MIETFDEIAKQRLLVALAKFGPEERPPGSPPAELVAAIEAIPTARDQASHHCRTAMWQLPMWRDRFKLRAVDRARIGQLAAEADALLSIAKQLAKIEAHALEARPLACQESSPAMQRLVADCIAFRAALNGGHPR